MYGDVGMNQGSSCAKVGDRPKVVHSSHSWFFGLFRVNIRRILSPMRAGSIVGGEGWMAFGLGVAMKVFAFCPS